MEDNTSGGHAGFDLQDFLFRFARLSHERESTFSLVGGETGVDGIRVEERRFANSLQEGWGRSADKESDTRGEHHVREERCFVSSAGCVEVREEVRGDSEVSKARRW